MKKKCLHCKKELLGRTDKKFCSVTCKNTYTRQRRKKTRDAVAEIDAYLHRNREILALLMGEASKIEIDRSTLTRAGFRYEYHTGTYFNKEGKLYRLVYDYAWMDFSDQKILMVRKKQPKNNTPAE
ncbi:MAG TPA: hypothetical protein PKA00_21310 [Saprospiraceae bacterium]|nr:hypothetical protein [Saprospiraceae bacterium]HMQ85463.1 hypothetical protein [Saprospiraceae bacterium]